MGRKIEVGNSKIMNMLKKYRASLIIGFLLLIPSPLFMFVIFMSGDSCCGENTSATMKIVTWVIITLSLLASFILNLIYKKAFRSKPSSQYGLLIGTIVSWIFPAILYYKIVATLISE